MKNAQTQYDQHRFTFQNNPNQSYQNTYENSYKDPQYKYYDGTGSQNFGVKNTPFSTNQSYGSQSLGKQATRDQVFGRQVGNEGQFRSSNLANTNYQISGRQLGNQIIVQQPIQQIPIQNRIEYIPFERKFIQYDQVERIQKVPVQRVITQFQQIKKIEKVPVQKMIKDYYAVEYQIEYIPRIFEEKVIDYVQQQRQFQRVQYLPIQTQIIHFPQAQLTYSQIYKNTNIPYGSTIIKPNVGQPAMIGDKISTSQYATAEKQISPVGQTYANKLATSKSMAGSTVPYETIYGDSSRSYGSNKYSPLNLSSGNAPKYDTFGSKGNYGKVDDFGMTGGNTVSYEKTGENKKEQILSPPQTFQPYYLRPYQN